MKGAATLVGTSAAVGSASLGRPRWRRRCALLLAAGLATTSLGVSASSPGADGRLEVVMTGLESTDGKVIFQLARSKEDFEEQDDKRSIYGEARASEGRAVYVFENLAPGEFAVKAFHDENDNDELDTNFLGIPKEAFGFSNNKMGRFGPPGYDDCTFQFKGPHEKIEVEARRF